MLVRGWRLGLEAIVWARRAVTFYPEPPSGPEGGAQRKLDGSRGLRSYCIHAQISIIVYNGRSITPARATNTLPGLPIIFIISLSCLLCSCARATAIKVQTRAKNGSASGCECNGSILAFLASVYRGQVFTAILNPYYCIVRAQSSLGMQLGGGGVYDVIAIPV